jgi:hypothetical protein
MSDAPIIVEGPTSVTITTAASVITDDREVAWATAEHQVKTRPDMGWLLGRYLGTDVANENGHIFRFGDIELAHDRIVHTPLNLLHRSTHVIGTFVSTTFVAAAQTAVDDDTGRFETGHVEALANVWRAIFRDEWDAISKANEEGSLFYSMEAIPKTVSCPACQATCAYAGPASDSYCEHMAKLGGPKVLDDPLFVGGAVVIPPAKPGWRNADLTQLAAAVGDQADQVYEQLAATDLSPQIAEQLMVHLLAGAFRDIPMTTVERIGARLVDRDFSPEERRRMAKSKVAMPDGSYPIPDRDALRRAIAAYGRGGNKAAVRRHIIKRARALGATDMLPDGWS